MVTLAYATLILVAVISSVPMFWMISTSLKADGLEFIYPPEWIPAPIVWRNYIDVWSESSLHLYTLNSFMVAGLATFGTLLSCSIVAFGFARLEFFGKNLLFGILVATLMLPGIVVLVPTFILFHHLNWINTPLPLVVPWWFGGGAFGGAFYVFLMRQFMLQLPRELDEAALVDGASYLRIYWQIILPLARPALAATGIFSFIHHWNDFLNPLIFLHSETWRTLALGLRYFLHGGGSSMMTERWNLMMAAAVVMLLPVLILFFSAQRYFIRGIALTGLTGK
jgi:multiple sugar transport system permease protein